MHVEVPMALANHIAKVCGLSGLFVGTYSNITVEYIWIGEYQRSMNHNYAPPIIVIKTNHWTRGVIDLGVFNYGHVALVDLKDWDDKLIGFLGQHDAIQRERDDDIVVVDGDSLYLRYINFHKDNSYHIGVPHYHSRKAVELLEVFLESQKSIYALIEKGRVLKDSAINYHKLSKLAHNSVNLGTQPQKHFKKKRDNPIDFLRLMDYVYSLGLRGLFNEHVASYDLNYVLIIYYYPSVDKPQWYVRDEIMWGREYIIVGTNRWILGGEYHSFVNENKHKDLSDFKLDWKQIIEQLPGSLEQHDRLRPIYGFHLMDASGQYYSEYDSLDTSLETLKLWAKIEPVIHLLEVGKPIDDVSFHNTSQGSDGFTPATLADSVRAFLSRWRNRDSSRRR